MSAWTAEDDDRLRAGWGLEPLARIAPAFGRSQACVQNRARKLGLVAHDPSRRFLTTPWTDADDRLLRDGWRRIDSRTLAEQLQRSHDAICRRARKLGLDGPGRVRPATVRV